MRGDSDNKQLRLGVVAAFGLVRASGAADVLQATVAAAGGEGPLSLAVVGPAALYALESLIVFGFASAAVEVGARPPRRGRGLPSWAAGCCCDASWAGRRGALCCFMVGSRVLRNEAYGVCCQVGCLVCRCINTVRWLRAVCFTVSRTAGRAGTCHSQFGVLSAPCTPCGLQVAFSQGFLKRFGSQQ